MTRPTVSLLMPILNEERNLPRSLGALLAQDYPKDRLEVLIADAGSADGSLEIVDRYRSGLNIRVLSNAELKEPEWGKAIAFRAAVGSYIQCVDADMWPSSPKLIGRLVDVMESDLKLSGVAARYYGSSDLSVWSRFLSHDEFQRDPLFESLTPSMSDFVSEQHTGFDVCTFPTPRVPPMGQTTMYRRDDIDLSRWNGSFNDIDLVAFLVKEGKKRFGFLHDVGWVHEHCTSLAQLLRKRRRNLLGQSSSFLRAGAKRDFVWLDATNQSEVMALTRHVVAANLLAPEFFRGVRRALQDRSADHLLRPIVALAIADSLILALFRDEEGRKWIAGLLRDTFSALRSTDKNLPSV